MSRGLGKIERKIIEVCKKKKRRRSPKGTWDYDIDLQTLVYYVFGLTDEVGDINAKYTQSQYISTYHAVKSLERKGIVETKREWDNFKLHWGTRGGATTSLLIRLRS